MTGRAGWLAVVGAAMAALAIGTRLNAGVTTPSTHLEHYIDEPKMIKLLESRDLQELKRLWDGLPYTDLVLRVVYYSRALRLAVSRGNELGLLETIPQNRLEFDFLYAINDTKAWSDHPALRELWDQYFKTIGRLTAKYPEYARRLLTMNRFADGEAKDFTDTATKAFRDGNPDAYLTGLKGLDHEIRAYICGDCPELRSTGDGKKPAGF